MKEAFEKIKERLEEESKFAVSLLNGKTDRYVAGVCDTNKKAIQIVSEVEAEFGKDINVLGNGWIPCSERMPEDFKSVLCYAKSIARSPDTMFVGSQKHGCWFLQSSIGTESFPTQYEVIAWMLLPEPWKGE